MALVEVNPTEPDAAVIARAAQVLRQGGLVAFPTETVYGLGANALNPAAVARIFEAKGRPAWNPVIAHVGSVSEAQQLSSHWPDVATVFARAFWPGPLTLVLPKHERVPDIVSAGLPAVGVRIPAHPVARALIAALGSPIAAPSANRFTELSPTTAAHVLAGLGDRVDLILDGGPCDVGIESAVVDLTGPYPVLLRPGVISREMLSQACGMPVAQADESAGDNTPQLSPGRTPRHYAPRATVWLFNRAEWSELTPALRLRIEASEPGSVAALVLHRLPLPPGVRVIPMPDNPLAYARSLYASLHDLDNEGCTTVAIERPPAGDAWAAVHDRLSRAAF